MMTRLGKFLKVLRVHRGEVLYDMAHVLKVSSSFLSAVENGKRSAPAGWLTILTDYYELDAGQQAELHAAINDSVRQVRLDLGNASEDRRQCALTFARRFYEFTDEDIRELMSVLEKGGN